MNSGVDYNSSEMDSSLRNNDLSDRNQFYKTQLIQKRDVKHVSTKNQNYNFDKNTENQSKTNPNKKKITLEEAAENFNRQKSNKTLKSRPQTAQTKATSNYREEDLSEKSDL